MCRSKRYKCITKGVVTKVEEDAGVTALFLHSKIKEKN